MNITKICPQILYPGSSNLNFKHLPTFFKNYIWSNVCSPRRVQFFILKTNYSNYRFQIFRNLTINLLLKFVTSLNGKLLFANNLLVAPQKKAFKWKVLYILIKAFYITLRFSIGREFIILAKRQLFILTFSLNQQFSTISTQHTHI